MPHVGADMHALHIVEQLSSLRGDACLPAAEIARREGLELSSVESLLGRLERAGLVESLIHGYVLTRPPERISFQEIRSAVLDDRFGPVPSQLMLSELLRMGAWAFERPSTAEAL